MITQDLREHLNSSFKKKINKIILNDVVNISDFEAKVENALLIVEFEIPEEISFLRKVEFFEEETLLSECQLHVPVSGNTLFKYRVEVE